MFSYTQNNPVNAIDLDGEETTGEFLNNWAKGVVFDDVRNNRSGARGVAAVLVSSTWDAFGFESLSKVADNSINGRDDMATSDYAFAAVDIPTAGKGHLVLGAILGSMKVVKGAKGASKAKAVIEETLSASKKDIISVHTLNTDEALEAGHKFVGDGYKEIGKKGSGVFRSADGTRRFRIDSGSLAGNHAPDVSHIHLETVDKATGKFKVNNHIPLKD